MVRTRETARKRTGGYQPPHVVIEAPPAEEEYIEVVDIDDSSDEDSDQDPLIESEQEEDPEEVQFFGGVPEEHQEEQDLAPPVPPTAPASPPVPPVSPVPPSPMGEPEEPARWVKTSYTHCGGDLRFPAMLDDLVRQVGYEGARITYRGERHAHPHYPDEWRAAVYISIPDHTHGGYLDIGVHHGPAFRSTFEAAMSDAAREAMTVFCETHQGPLANSRHRYCPRRQSGEVTTWISSFRGEPDQRLRTTIMYMAALSTDLDAALEEIRTLRDTSSGLRARLGGLDDEVLEIVPHSPPRKRTRYGEPGTGTFVKIT
jgi:hypothetical protein